MNVEVIQPAKGGLENFEKLLSSIIAQGYLIIIMHKYYYRIYPVCQSWAR